MRAVKGSLTASGQPWRHTFSPQNGLMRVDLLAGTLYACAAMTRRAPTILVFDSGLGGLTVLAEVARARPDAQFVYAADDAGFPYGRLSEPELVRRTTTVMEALVRRHRPDLVVVACNTASTLVLPHLRRAFDLPFVGTVPAIKPAAGLSRSGLVSVLATPGTVARDYTRDLVHTYAAACQVTLVGARRLAELAEAELQGRPPLDEDVLAEIRPCFVAEGERRTDVVVLGCTHYPLLAARFRQLAPWPVAWIDSGAAIAGRVRQLLGPVPAEAVGADPAPGLAVFTSGAALNATLRGALAARGLATVAVEPVPMAEA